MAQKEEVSEHEMQAVEYAKIHAIKERIAGLGKAMVAIVIAGAFTAFVAFLELLFAIATSASPLADPVPYSLAISTLVFLPFVLLAYFFRIRVSRHIDRLSRGRFEPILRVED